jgi:hypothetical protein
MKKKRKKEKLPTGPKVQYGIRAFEPSSKVSSFKV